MKNPLHSLDELVWKQFSKLTAYAHQRYGWNNYDLAQAAFAGVGLTLAGEGSRLLYSYLQADDPVKSGISAVFGSSYLLSAPLIYSGLKEKFSAESKKEHTKSLCGEYSFEYSPSTARPLILAGSAWYFLPPVNALAGLFFLAAAAGFYLEHQEFRPSRKKRNNVERIVFKG